MPLTCSYFRRWRRRQPRPRRRSSPARGERESRSYPTFRRLSSDRWITAAASRAVLVEHLLSLYPLGDHLVDGVLIGTEAEGAARQVQVLPCVVDGLEQSRDLAGLELGDPSRLRLKLEDVRLHPIGARVAVSVFP